MRTRAGLTRRQHLLDRGATLVAPFAAGARWKPNVSHRSPTRPPVGKEPPMRKILYALASLSAFAMAVGAGWRPN